MFPDIKSFVTQKFGSRELNDLYELKDEVDKHYNTYKQLEKQAVDAKGQKEFREYLDNYSKQISISKQLRNSGNAINKLRNYENINSY